MAPTESWQMSDAGAELKGSGRTGVCLVCQRFIRGNSGAMTTHVKSHTDHKDGRFGRKGVHKAPKGVHKAPKECQVCEAVFSGVRKLSRHLADKHGMKLAQGKKGHSEDLPEPDGYKRETSEGEGSMKKEEEFIPSEDYPFVCNLCLASFASQTELGSHATIEHLWRNITHACRTCKTPLERSKHAGHLKSHGPRHRLDYVCIHCGKHLPLFQNLFSHVYAHTGRKPFRCGHCGRQFCFAGASGYHVALCRGLVAKVEETTPPKIEEQEHGSYEGQDSSLSKYEVGSPCETKPTFQCHMCERSFTKPHHLGNHMRYHRNRVPPITCSWCGERFFRGRTEYALHLTNRHADVALMCDCAMCGGVFRDKYALRRHVRELHF